MKMLRKNRKWIIVLAAIFILTPFVGKASHHNTETLKGKVRSFYQHLRNGEFEEALDNIMIGGMGFLPSQFLFELSSEEVRNSVVERYSSAYENGRRLNLTPKHITVKEYGCTAVTAYYLDGVIIDTTGKTKNVLRRGTVVWVMEDDDWKIAHWHISDMVAAND